MPDELVTIAYEFSPLKANMMRTRLEADGIDCFIYGETLASVVGSASYASGSWDHPQGNIQVQVPLLQAGRARELLREIESTPLDDDEEWPREAPSRAIRLFRVCISGAVSFYAGLSIAAISNIWWIGVFAGVMIFTILCYLSLKKPFKSKQ